MSIDPRRDDLNKQVAEALLFAFGPPPGHLAFWRDEPYSGGSELVAAWTPYASELIEWLRREGVTVELSPEYLEELDAETEAELEGWHRIEMMDSDPDLDEGEDAS